MTHVILVYQKSDCFVRYTRTQSPLKMLEINIEVSLSIYDKNKLAAKCNKFQYIIETNDKNSNYKYADRIKYKEIHISHYRTKLSI